MQGGASATEPTRMSLSERLSAAGTCCAPRSGAHGTRYLPPNRRPRACVTLASVSPVELHASRAGADRLLRPQVSASHPVRLAHFCTPLLLTSWFRGAGVGDTKTNHIHGLIWPGQKSLAPPTRTRTRTPTGLFREFGGRPRGAGPGLCALRCAEEPGWVWVSRGRVEGECLGPRAPVGCGALAGPGQGWGEPSSGKEDKGFPEGERTRHSQGSERGERARCATLTAVPGPTRASARVQMQTAPVRRTRGVRDPRPCGVSVQVILPRSGWYRGEARASL